MKKCINCGNELFDEAIMCPKCKTEQQIATQIYFPSETEVKKRKIHKGYIKAVIAVLSSLIAVIIIVAVCLCGYQIKRATYIDSQLSTWIEDIEKGDFDDIRETIDKYNMEKNLESKEFLSSVWKTLFPDNMESVTKLFCKEWDTYNDINNLYNQLKLIDECYEPYKNWTNGEIDKASSEWAMASYSLLNTSISIAEVMGNITVMDESLCKYDWFKPYYDKLMEFMPTAENVSGSVYAYDSYSSYADCATITIKNNNFYPIDVSDIEAEVNITLMMIPTYGNPDFLRINEPVKLDIQTSNDNGDDTSLIYGGESATYEFDMNIEDRYYSSYISYVLYDSSVSVSDAEK